MSNLTGQQLGNYRLVRHLGAGGCGEVYLGVHVRLQRESAIKLLLKLDAQEVERFHNEAQIIARLTHPHIITLFDYDVVGEMPFLVMMYAPKGSMRARRRPGVRIPLAEVVTYIIQAADGLQFAHDQQVLHRDVKPANMLLGADGQILLSDFGLAVMWNGTHSLHTQRVVGTQGYMAPEQFQGHSRPASDQYSLAVTAYEWLSGSRPKADAPLGLGMLQLAYPGTEIPPVRRVVPHLPPQVDEVLQRALAREWQARFPSVREFAEELARAASSGGLTTYVMRSATSIPTGSSVAVPAPSSARPGTQDTNLSTLPGERRPSVLTTQPAGAALRSSSLPTHPKTAPAQAQSGSSSLIAPPPPPESYSGYSNIAPPPPPPGARQLIPVRVLRPLALPVARAGNARAIWTWTLGYTVFLLALGGVLVALAATYGANTVPSAWIIVLTVIESILLLVAGTVLCGALLGRWRALVVSLLSFGLTFLGLYLVLAHTFATSGGSGDSTSWTGLLFYGMLPLSAFVVGWICERRREANFGKSFLSMLAGTTFLILLPLTLVYILGSTGSPTGSTIAAYLLGIWCFLILLVFPLALVAASLEALLHKMVQSAVDGKKKDGG